MRIIFHLNGCRFHLSGNIFKRPVAGHSGGVGAGGNVSTGSIGKRRAQCFAVSCRSQIAAVKHNVGIGSQVFPDLRPCFRIHIVAVDDLAAQRKISFTAVRHKMDRIVFHIAVGIQILVDLRQTVFSAFKDQHILIGQQFGKYSFFIGNTVVDDYQFAGGGERQFCSRIKHHRHIRPGGSAVFCGNCAVGIIKGGICFRSCQNVQTVKIRHTFRFCGIICGIFRFCSIFRFRGCFLHLCINYGFCGCCFKQHAIFQAEKTGFFLRHGCDLSMFSPLRVHVILILSHTNYSMTYKKSKCRSSHFPFFSKKVVKNSQMVTFQSFPVQTALKRSPRSL